MSKLTLFLDYDGVLHPAKVWYERNKGYVLRHEGRRLFDRTTGLVDLLDEFGTDVIQIVLSTSWVTAENGWQAAADHLHPRLRAYVVDGTFDFEHEEGWSRREWREMTRYQQINRYFRTNGLSRWIAVDDDVCGWAEDQTHRLVATESLEGLTSAHITELRRKIEAELKSNEKPLQPYLFLDFDGVLHPNRLGESGYFEFEECLRPICYLVPDLRIVLSTSWVETHGFEMTRDFLHPNLARKVVGMTFDGRPDWDDLTRFEQIKSYVDAHGIEDWIAIDDDVKDWHTGYTRNLVECDGRTGIGADKARVALLKAIGKWRI